ncbi:hypothetical protein FDECE_13792 [Fusarium decemcellulare]|nr:hypothetical protein FDECE_13792 [Fusarium decemcellulare]
MHLAVQVIVSLRLERSTEDPQPASTPKPHDSHHTALALASPNAWTALGYLSLTWSPLHHLRGEQAATALEANLSNLESKLDAILARLDAQGDSQSSTSAAATKAEDPVKASDGKVETQVDVDTDKEKGKEDSA